MSKSDFGRTIRTALLSLIGFLTVLTAYLAAYNVEEGFVGIIKRNGAIERVADPGLGFKIPYIDTIEHVETRERAANLEIEATTNDPVVLPMTATINWLANREAIVTLYREYGSLEQFERRIVLPAFQSSVKDAAGRDSIETLFRERSSLEKRTMEMVKGKIPTRVMTVTNVYIRDITFPADYVKQVLDKKVSSEAVLTEKNRLEQQKLQATQITQTSQAQADANKALSDAEAYKIAQEGIARAKAITEVGKALSANPLVIEYKKAETWGGQFPSTFMGGEQGSNILWSLPGSSRPAQ